MTDFSAIPQDAWMLAILTFGLGLCAGVVWWAMVMDRVDPQPKPRSTLYSPAKRLLPRDAKGRFMKWQPPAARPTPVEVAKQTLRAKILASRAKTATMENAK